ncbi:anaerobic ribonucleoside-triphosphate reductase activating protein [bacterium]|nr:anaerobic ribonucleoside-triphosphate reductase activating protein [bacterium]
MRFCISGFQKTSLIDFPQKIACIVFTNGCNFKCGYCHNPELFTNKEPALSVPDFFAYLNTRKNKLDGVVITGGEPTLQKDLQTFIQKIKDLDFCVKLDTNGTNPNVIEKLLKSNLLDYIAMDIKAPLSKYKSVTNVDYDVSKIEKSIDLIKNSDIDYEFRTTVIKSQLSIEDFKQIGEEIKGAKAYYLQEFIPTKILDESLLNEKSYTKEEFKNICSMLRNYVKVVDFR